MQPGGGVLHRSHDPTAARLTVLGFRVGCAYKDRRQGAWRSGSSPTQISILFSEEDDSASDQMHVPRRDYEARNTLCHPPLYAGPEAIAIVYLALSTFTEGLGSAHLRPVLATSQRCNHHMVEQLASVRVKASNECVVVRPKDTW
jgi:hypothetical protein